MKRVVDTGRRARDGSEMDRPALVPELMVADHAASLAFWCGLCGFRILFERPEEGFACVERDGAWVMLDELPQGRAHRWEVAPAEPPFGRHVNFEIAVDDLAPILAALEAARWPLFLAPETRTYRVGAGDVPVRQFLVQDPDGYLLRFSQRLGGRAAGSEAGEDPAAAPRSRARKRAVRRAAPSPNRRPTALVRS